MGSSREWRYLSSWVDGRRAEVHRWHCIPWVAESWVSGGKKPKVLYFNSILCSIGVIESVKSTGDLISPMAGIIERINVNVLNRPGLINMDPWEAGISNGFYIHRMVVWNKSECRAVRLPCRRGKINDGIDSKFVAFKSAKILHSRTSDRALGLPIELLWFISSQVRLFW